MHTPAERACRMTVRGKRHARLLTNLVSLRIPEEHVAHIHVYSCLHIFMYTPAVLVLDSYFSCCVCVCAGLLA
jgi:hypothetical protein